MKKISVFCIVALLMAAMFSGCKKDSKNPATSTTESMKLTLNANAVSYNSCLGSDATIGSTKETIITGLNLTNNTPGADSFEIEIVHDISTLKAGEVFQAANSFGQADGMALYYFPNDNDTFVTQPANPQGTVTITAVTSTTISGTFSGKLFASADLSGTTVKYTVISGTFTARTK